MWRLTDKHNGYSNCKSKLLCAAIKLSASGVMVILVGNGYGDTSSNPGRG